jgi:hypothetical protein
MIIAYIFLDFHLIITCPRCCSDDVEAVVRAGVRSCCRNPEQCPSVVSLLAESYNPHVRYGAAMALGIACAGTGLKVSVTECIRSQL